MIVRSKVACCFLFSFSQCRKRKPYVVFWQVMRTFLCMIMKLKIACCFFHFPFHNVESENRTLFFNLCSVQSVHIYTVHIFSVVIPANRKWQTHARLQTVETG